MRLFVCGEVGGLRESLVASLKFADVRFLACVGSEMRLQVKVKWEALPANLTAIRPLTGVDELMSPQLRVIHKTFPTTFHLTNVHLHPVCEEVFLHRGWIGEYFSAVFMLALVLPVRYYSVAATVTAATTTLRSWTSSVVSIAWGFLPHSLISIRSCTFSVTRLRLSHRRMCSAWRRGDCYSCPWCYSICSWCGCCCWCCCWGYSSMRTIN